MDKMYLFLLLYRIFGRGEKATEGNVTPDMHMSIDKYFRYADIP